MTDHQLFKGHVVLPADPRVLTLVPHAKRTTFQGQDYVVVPHKLDEARMLRNLGYKVPPPILTDYDWCQTTPFDAQRITAAAITMNPASFVLNSMGTGKTRSVLFAYDYLRRAGQVDKLLVVAPLSTLNQTWGREIQFVFPHLRYRVLHGSKAKRMEALDDHADIYIINHDGVEVILPALIARRDIDMICLDELTAYKEARTDRWKATNQLVRRMKWKVGMTGTPMPNGPMDAYAQKKIISPETAGGSYTAFRDRTMTRVSQFKWVPKKDSTEAVYNYLQPAVRFTRDECYDLPDVMYVDREAALSGEQAKFYKEMAEECAVMLRDGHIKAMNEADRLNKLVQIALGTVYTSDHGVVQLPCPSRMAALDEAIEEAEAKVIVFTPYKSSLDMLCGHVGQRWSVARIDGDVPRAKREEIFTAFMHEDDPRVLIAHPETMSHGLDLTRANVVVWYGPPLSLETYEQANGRITRAGQKFKQLIVNIQATKVEEAIYRRLKQRAAMQGLLLDLYEAQSLDRIL